MAEINHQLSFPSPEIASSGIHIPDESDLGTGTFTVVTNPVSLKANTVIAASIVNLPRFQITATLNPGPSTVAITLGVISDREPGAKTVFKLPRYVKWNKSHTLVVQFAKWQIFSTTLDGKPLLEQVETSH